MFRCYCYWQKKVEMFSIEHNLIGAAYAIKTIEYT